jgi:tetratricopeptide (TPR) repeat protein
MRSRERKPTVRRETCDPWELIDRGCWDDARDLLEDQLQHHPHRLDSLYALLEVYQHFQQYSRYTRTCRRLIRLDPDEPELHLMLASGLLATGCPASSLKSFRRFVDRWPDHPLAESAREELSKLEPLPREMLKESGIIGDDAFELAEQHEQIMAHLSEGEFDEVMRLAERLLVRWPDFVPARNNLSEAYFRRGEPDRAIAAARRVLELDPDNFHAQANLTRYLYLSGSKEEVAACASRLKALHSDNPDVWSKKAETFAYLGDDEGVLEALRGAEDADDLDPSPSTALLHHLGAVALLRQGDSKEARWHWRKALSIDPDFRMAAENLADFEKPSSERHAPWAFGLEHWLRREAIDQMVRELPTEKSADEETSQRLARFFERHPELRTIIPALLDGGLQVDPDNPQRRKLESYFSVSRALGQLVSRLT